MSEPKRDVLAELEAMIAGLSPKEKADLTKLAEGELSKPWLPNPGKQADALLCQADILLYGGQAGGGKSALEIGAFFAEHYSGIIFRREGTQLDGLIEYCKKVGEPKFGRFVGGNENVFKRNDGGRLKFAGLNGADDWRKHAGNARDYIAFDEAGEFLREQVMSIIGWLRSTREGQRCRVILGSNPPRGGDGDWMIEEFAPWLDPTFPEPAEDGELRWAIVVASVTEWVEGPGMYERGGETYEAMSRTFISASLDDNPYLKDTGYRAKIQSLPEPLRSQLLYGNFLAGRQDHEWQVIPSAWVLAANERWRKANNGKRRKMLALAADIALGGSDNLVMASLYDDNWFAPLTVVPGSEFGGATGSSRIAWTMLRERRDGADLSLDGTGGWGAGARSHLKQDHETDCASIVFSKASNASTSDGQLEYYNLRAEMYWSFREALHPELGDDIALPPDPRLFAELTAQRYGLKRTKIIIKPKEEQTVSPDRADAVVMAWRRRNAWARKAAIKATQNKPMVPPVPAGPSSWMG